jgi:hypothetical protein
VATVSTGRARGERARRGRTVWTGGCRHRDAVARRVIQERRQFFLAGDHELRPREFVAPLRVLALELGDGDRLRRPSRRRSAALRQRPPHSRLILLAPQRERRREQSLAPEQRADLARRATLRGLLDDRGLIIDREPSPCSTRCHLRRPGRSVILRLLSCHRTNLQCPLCTSPMRRGISSHTILAGGALSSAFTIRSAGIRRWDTSAPSS